MPFHFKFSGRRSPATDFAESGRSIKVPEYTSSMIQFLNALQFMDNMHNACSRRITVPKLHIFVHPDRNWQGSPQYDEWQILPIALLSPT